MFLFKGNRNYLHSSDIFNFINNKYNYNHLDIKFHKLLKSQPKIKFTKKLENNHNASIVTQIIEKKSKKFLIFYDSNINIKNNYSYDENLLNKFFKINSDGVKCNFSTTISYIDLIVSMTTKWHLSKIGKKKWMVIRINLKKKIIESNHKNIFIKVDKIINKKYTESKIFIDKKLFGKIYFSAVKL